MPKFKVIGGFHDHTEPGSPSHGRRFQGEVRSPAGQVTRPGEVLQSRHDLRLDFANKFELMPDSTPLSPGQPIPGGEIARQLAEIEAKTPLKPTVTHAPPAPVPVAAAETPISGATAENAAPEPAEAENAPETPQGKDVTKQFPKALEEDYRVFKQGKTFAVYNADDMGKVAEGIDRSAVDDAIAADVKKLSKA